MIWPGNKTLVLSRYGFVKDDIGKYRNVQSASNVVKEPAEQFREINASILRIIHLSDLQGASFGENNIELLNRISDARPHLIVFSGDLVDRRMHVDKDFKAVIDFMKNLRGIAPTFFSYGNHELAFSESTVDSLRERLENSGVVALDGTSHIEEVVLDGTSHIEEEVLDGTSHVEDAEIHTPSDHEMRNIRELDYDKPRSRKLKILLTGFPEKLLMVEGKNRTKKNSDVNLGAARSVIEDIKQKRSESQCDMSILLAHEPQFIEEYAAANYDFIFSGHAHGGQIRLPLLGGLFSPGQGVLPKFTSGVHCAGNGMMIISRGLGNSSFPIRLFNRPEIVLAEIRI